MTFWTLAGGVCLGLAAAAAAIKALPTIWQFIKAIANAPFVIESVAKEFSPNGGGSLRDAIDRMEDKFDAHVERDEKAFGELADALTAERILAAAQAAEKVSEAAALAAGKVLAEAQRVSAEQPLEVNAQVTLVDNPPTES